MHTCRVPRGQIGKIPGLSREGESPTKTREMATRRLVALTLALVRAAHGSEKRDVIMIMADDMRPELNAAYGCAA